VKIGPDRNLYATFSTGEQATADNAGSYAGKIVRVTEDGLTPPDNPASSPIVSLGHMLVGGFDWQPGTNLLWLAERDARARDRLSAFSSPLRALKTSERSLARRSAESVEFIQAFAIEPALDPSGATFYSHSLLPGFANDLFVGALAGKHLRRIHFDPHDLTRIAAAERLLDGQYGRISDVVTGPDGTLYLCTSNVGTGSAAAGGDQLLRMTPANSRP
jgi:glucose/arabinose dehydrogenase